VKLPSLKCKPETVVSKDKSRPVLTHLYLRITEGESIGSLQATDSYKAVRIPVEVGKDDTEGFVSPDVYKAARKVTPKTAGGVEFEVNGGYTLADGTTHPREFQGTWPKLDEIMDVPASTFTVGLNARFLFDLAQAFGSDTVKITFTAGRGGSDPDPLRPMKVEPIDGDLKGSSADGILMPVRVAS